LTEARAALADTRKLVNRVDDHIDPLLTTTQQAFQQAIATLHEAETTVAAAQGVIEPDSTVMIQVRDSLREINTAATAIRVLADYLQRNPNALLTGK
jgi:paraquat-inducible protein B